jgi:hypothetical protein
MLVRLLYASFPAGGSTAGLVESILSSCRANNPSMGITGVLCYSDQSFMQVLEGGRAAVNTLYGQILRDQRHEDVTLLYFEEITERSFGGWTMGHVNLERINPSVLLKYCELPELRPEVMTGATAMALLKDLFASASIMGRT